MSRMDYGVIYATKNGKAAKAWRDTCGSGFTREEAGPENKKLSGLTHSRVNPLPQVEGAGIGEDAKDQA